MDIKITDSELKIMMLLWESPMTMKSLYTALDKNVNTIKTLLYRLKNKNIIFQKNNIYYTKVTYQEYTQQEIINHIKKNYDGDVRRFAENITKNKNIEKTKVEYFINRYTKLINNQ